MRKKDRIFIATEQGTPENIAWLKSQGFEVVVDSRLLPDEWKILVEKKTAVCAPGGIVDVSVEKMKKLLHWANSRLEKAKSLQERIRILRHCSKKGLSLPVAATLYLAEIGTKEKRVKKRPPKGSGLEGSYIP